MPNQQQPRPAGTLQGARRKVVHATLYELIAIAIVTLAMWLWSGKGMAESSGLALSCTVLALAWNMAFNTWFEHWEQQQASRERTVQRRIAHAIGFEGGLAILTVPVIAWWLDVGWWTALLADIGLLLFFLLYTFAFNWVFDHAFGLPASAVARQ
jgi:uncharacterized membrane protein